jgi:hypothetical protein
MGELQFRPGFTPDRLTITQLEVKQVEVLGNLSSGGTQLLGPIVAGQLASEPGFEPHFNGSVKYAGDYLTQDPTDGIARPACVGAVYPDNGDSPFLFRISGVDHASATAAEIFTSSENLNLSIPYGFSYSGSSSQWHSSLTSGWHSILVWTPTFYGGSEKYSVLQNSVFVASETVASSNKPGYFLVGMKISKIWPKNTTVTIGNEFAG